MKIIWAAAASLALATSAFVQLQNENLLVEMPKGYKIGFQDSKNNARISEIVPGNETVDD